MQALIAIDSFKGSLSSKQACDIVAGVLSPAVVCRSFPIGDGGEGTASIIAACRGLDYVKLKVKGIYERTLATGYYLGGSVAVIESAAFVGLNKQSLKQDGLLFYDTYGLGQAVMHALDRGAREFILCLGGSGTNDGGAGLLRRLGVSFYDRQGNALTTSPFALQSLESIDVTSLDRRLRSCTFTVLCDVNNPLCGPNGCSAVFAGQKGASARSRQEMDRTLDKYATLLQEQTGIYCQDAAGSGAAGGLGFACMCALGARCVSGIGYIMELLHFADEVARADVVISGEGKIDSQTMQGKVISGIAQLCRQYDKPLYLMAGSSEVTPDELDACVKRILCLKQDGMTIDACIANAASLLQQRAQELLRTLTADACTP